MHFDWSTFALQAINFAVLVWLLNRFLYKPVLGVIEARRVDVEREYERAKNVEEAAKARLAIIEKEHAGLATEREAVLRSAATQAEEAARARHAQVERESKALIDEGRKTLSVERENVLAEARRLALDLGADVARRLLTEVPFALRAEAWIERIEHYLAALPETERQGLIRQFAHGERLAVLTSSPLPAAIADGWRDRLHRRLGNDIPIEFAVNAGLVDGAELHFPSAILRFSWQSALAAVHSEMDAHGDAH
ncbi:MAG TPA: hypothetical protein VGU20_15870 [Stellaceae bacterium]|nr:hypothetical protein [Stellaceae bacterium]